ncbi:hypothetical protein LPJ66_006243 [Kickxella alabastrina]|uniref:Uncharacterized protein n=1 Tax=Kickxella alabastrina TaxID=61397 RepID=A0ACC1IG05_9FUNG|nr:hypothetical protein LPJ66_006243 [Kickxella alabastrina]
MVPLMASDNTPLFLLYGGTSNTEAKDPIGVASSGISNLHIFNTTSSKWYAPDTTNAPKSGPILPGCGADGQSIWAYDPQYGVPNKASTGVSLLDSANWSWRAPTQAGQLPVTRFGAAFAYALEKKSFYMHGGIPLNVNTNTAEKPPGIANYMDILSPLGVSWNYASNGPARKYHTLCYMKSIESLVMFGGSDQNIASYNDIKVFSVNTNIWQYAVTVDGDLPAERILHSAVCTDDTMYMFGGLNSMDDAPSDSTVWMLKTNGAADFTWSRAPIITGSGLNSGPTARAGHSAVLHNNNMYIFGGIGPSGQDKNMYALDLKTWKWAASTGDTSDGVKDEGRVNTRVLIAAVVSSVLGVICIGIAAFGFYRWNRRRGTARYPFPGDSKQSGDGSESGPNLDCGGNSGFVGGGEKIHQHNGSNSGPDASDGSGDDRAVAAIGVAAIGIVAGAMKAGVRKDYTQQHKSSGYLLADSSGSGTTQNCRVGSDIVANNYLPPVHTNPSLGSSVMTFSPPMSPLAHMDLSASSSSSNSNIALHIDRAQTPVLGQGYRQNGASVVPMSQSYSHADVINGILHSGQPIPAWLREAARRAPAENDNDIGFEASGANVQPLGASARQQAALVAGNEAARSAHSDTTNGMRAIKYMDTEQTRQRESMLSEVTFDYDTPQTVQGFGARIPPAIAEPMEPPVPLRMDSLYGELEDDNILSPLDRLAQYHNLDSWAGPGRNRASLAVSEGGETDDTSNIYPAQPVRRSGDDF